MEITRIGSQPSGKGPEDWFTGSAAAAIVTLSLAHAWVAPNEKHWHGASRTVAITHITTQEQQNGKVVDLMEKVSDEQYQK